MPDPALPLEKRHVLRDTSFHADRPSHEPPPAAGPRDAPRNCHVLRDTLPNAAAVVLELRVRNHPGTMSHVTGLFARRAFNLDAIICVPIDDGSTSRMLLLVPDEPRLEQVERQLARLYDVLELRHRRDLTPDYFHRLAGD